MLLPGVEHDGRTTGDRDRCVVLMGEDPVRGTVDAVDRYGEVARAPRCDRHQLFEDVIARGTGPRCRRTHGSTSNSEGPARTALRGGLHQGAGEVEEVLRGLQLIGLASVQVHHERRTGGLPATGVGRGRDLHLCAILRGQHEQFALVQVVEVGQALVTIHAVHRAQ